MVHLLNPFFPFSPLLLCPSFLLLFCCVCARVRTRHQVRRKRGHRGVRGRGGGGAASGAGGGLPRAAREWKGLHVRASPHGGPRLLQVDSKEAFRSWTEQTGLLVNFLSHSSSLGASKKNRKPYRSEGHEPHYVAERTLSPSGRSPSSLSQGHRLPPGGPGGAGGGGEREGAACQGVCLRQGPRRVHRGTSTHAPARISVHNQVDFVWRAPRC